MVPEMFDLIILFYIIIIYYIIPYIIENCNNILRIRTIYSYIIVIFYTNILMSN